MNEWVRRNVWSLEKGPLCRWSRRDFARYLFLSSHPIGDEGNQTDDRKNPPQVEDAWLLWPLWRPWLIV